MNFRIWIFNFYIWENLGKEIKLRIYTLGCADTTCVVEIVRLKQKYVFNLILDESIQANLWI